MMSIVDRLSSLANLGRDAPLNHCCLPFSADNVMSGDSQLLLSDLLIGLTERFSILDLLELTYRQRVPLFVHLCLNN
jgi:hypothetical protein